MKKFIEVTCEKLGDVFCDVCGESCKREVDYEYATLKASWGYDSNKDLQIHNIQLCESCFDKTILFLKQIKTISIEPDPLDGEWPPFMHKIS